jgi:hypothetical protein
MDIEENDGNRTGINGIAFFFALSFSLFLSSHPVDKRICVVLLVVFV